MCLECGKPLAGCPGHTVTPPTTTKSVKFTLAHDLTGADHAAVQNLIAALYGAVLGGNSTFITGTTEIVTNMESASKIVDAAEALGIKPSTRDL